ncbi:MAG: helix-turn-helix domain-containing protein [Parvibaculum sp.]
MSELESPGRAPASTREKTAENSADRSGKRGDTRARLMEAAERLFGERGLHAVTLKEINAAAGQRNESALHYHFGSKARLVDAILNTRVAAIDRVRVQRVEALVGSGREGDLGEILRATFEPLTGLLDTEEGVRFVRFAAQVLNDPDFDLPTVALRSGFQGISRANTLIVSVLGDLPPEIAVQRQRLMVEMALTSLAIWTRRPDAMTNSAARSFFVASLFDAIAGALTAPVSEETLAALKQASKH